MNQLRQEKEQLERAWTSYVHGRLKNNISLRPNNISISRDVIQSWERSSRLINHSCLSAPAENPQETDQEWRDSLLYAAARPLLEEIERTADETDYVVAVCDGSGKLLWTHSSLHMLRRAERLNFVPGGLFNEASVGTNALDMALRTVMPARIFSAEHFILPLHDWVCYSTPIRDPASGLPLGVLDFSSTWQKANAMGLLTATALARYIEERLAKLAPPRIDSRRLAILSPLYLQLCGTPRVWFEGERLKLSPRQLEILALLALHPEGLNLDSLHAYLYGDRAVSFSTLKAEVSVLRSLLNGRISSRPYLLSMEYQVDALQVQAFLEAGNLPEALKRYHGPLLPDSESPHLNEWRAYLEEAVRSAVDQADNAELMWLYGSRHPDDFEMLLRLARLLKSSDPRLPLVRARLKLLNAAET